MLSFQHLALILAPLKTFGAELWRTLVNVNVRSSHYCFESHFFIFMNVATMYFVWKIQVIHLVTKDPLTWAKIGYSDFLK